MNWRAMPTLFRLGCSRHTDNVTNAVSEAWGLAAGRNYATVTPEQILAAIASDRRTILGRIGLQLDPVEIAELAGPPRPTKPACRPGLDRTTRELLADARVQARRLGHPYVGTEHIVLALLLGPARPASDLMLRRGLTPRALIEAICPKL